MKRIAVLLLISLFILTACGTLTGDVLTFKSADPALSVAFRLLPAPDVVVPPCHTIAGNINSQGQHLWHDESSRQWGQIRIDESKGERWFCDSASAEAAGWTKAGGN